MSPFLNSKRCSPPAVSNARLPAPSGPPAASLDQQYLAFLSSVAAGGPDGAGNLALETAGREQRMLFKNGGIAPQQ